LMKGEVCSAKMHFLRTPPCQIRRTCTVCTFQGAEESMRTRHLLCRIRQTYTVGILQGGVGAYDGWPLQHCLITVYP
jgi:hypothetical protein